ncbi:MAG: hypothetical protein J1F04_06345 [Oscillospiraceae bacterium]|nr:hypothetical protein [Oscillospiraceae bacterium]
MKNERLFNIIGEIDDKYIEEAVPGQKHERKRGISWAKWGAVAAGAAVVAAAVVIPLSVRNSAVLPNDSAVQSESINSTVKPDNSVKPDTDDPDRYKDFTSVTVQADRLPWDWEDLTLSAIFWSFTFEDREYTISNRDEEIGEDWLERSIGECEAVYTPAPWDYYGKYGYTETLTVYKIKGIDENYIVAAGNDKEKYVYCNKGKTDTPPDTLGKLFEIYDLPSLAELDFFTEYEGEVRLDFYLTEQNSPDTVIGRYDLKNGDEIWRILSECKDAKLGDYAPDKKTFDSEHCVRFTVFSEPLGTAAYSQDIFITDDGYFWTNIFGYYNYNYVYDIGEDIAQQIISFAKSNAETAERRRLSNRRYVLGTITEIGDGYVVIDDTIACKNPNDGTTFKVLTDKTVIRRELKGITQTGGLLYFEYRYKADENNVIDSATSVNFAHIEDGKIWVAYC